MAERTEVHYNGFLIVAAFFAGKFQGRAYYQDNFKAQLGATSLSADGVDVESVVHALKEEIDQWLAENEEIIKKLREEQLLERHRQFLERRGIKYLGVRPATKVKRRRVTHCYACKSHLDNLVNTECVACHWILCNCGACGCGWEGHYEPA